MPVFLPTLYPRTTQISCLAFLTSFAELNDCLAEPDLQRILGTPMDLAVWSRAARAWHARRMSVEIRAHAYVQRLCWCGRRLYMGRKLLQSLLTVNLQLQCITRTLEKTQQLTHGTDTNKGAPEMPAACVPNHLLKVARKPYVKNRQPYICQDLATSRARPREPRDLAAFTDPRQRRQS